MDYLNEVENQIIREEIKKIKEIDRRFLNVFFSYHFSMSNFYQDGDMDKFRSKFESLIKKLKKIYGIENEDLIISNFMLMEKLERDILVQIDRVNANLLLIDKKSEKYGKVILYIKAFLENIINTLNLLSLYHIEKN